MKFFSFILLICPVIGRLFTKMVPTPIYESSQLCSAHHVILLKQTPFQEYESELENIYLLDFSPCDDITNYSTLWKMATGQKIQGKVRLLHLDTCNLSETFLPSVLENAQTRRPLDTIKDLDRALYNKVQEWDPSCQLYTRNCQHFGRYIQG